MNRYENNQIIREMIEFVFNEEGIVEKYYEKDVYYSSNYDLRLLTINHVYIYIYYIFFNRN